MPFGKHIGQEVGSLTSDYLKWIYLNVDNLSDQLVREIYLTLTDREQTIPDRYSWEARQARQQATQRKKQEEYQRQQEARRQHEEAHRERERRREEETRKRQQQPQNDLQVYEIIESLLGQWFRRMALRFHPDRGGSDRDMQVVNICHEEFVKLLAEPDDPK
jgi:hypothetical protein